MAKIRFGYSDDFTAKDSSVGINTAEPQTNLDVVGSLKGKELKVVGVSSQTGYEGFLRADHQIEEETQLNFGQGVNSSLSGEIIVGTGQTVTVTENLKEDRLGPELITNGQFLSNVDDWTAFNSSNSFNNGRLRITRSGGTGLVTYQLITNLVPGATYFASAIVNSIGSRGDFRIVNGNSWNSNYYLIISGTNGQVKTLSGSFTATGTTALVGFSIDNNSTLIEVDQVTVRRVNDVEEPGTNVAGGSQVECMKVYNTFTPPSGDTNQRPSKPKPGQLYYNYDFKTIEFHDGYGWRQVDNTTRSGRGVFMGGRSYPAPDTAGPPIADISYIQISSRGNALDFGNLESGNARESGACLGSSIRSIKGGGTASDGTEQNDIQYVTTASQGNAIDFGDLTNRVRSFGAVSTSTRGLFAGGCVHPNTDTNHIDFIQISTLGSTAEFGDHVAGRNIQGIGNQIKAVFGNGNGSHTIRSINFASKGDTTIFGEVFMVTSGSGTVGNSVRGLFCGGYAISPNGTSVINSITFASDGNGTDFGEMNGAHQTASSGGMSSATKGVFGPGQATFVGSNNVIHFLDEITISTYGSATDFGDSGPHGNFTPKVSDSHGGLGGF